MFILKKNHLHHAMGGYDVIKDNGSQICLIKTVIHNIFQHKLHSTNKYQKFYIFKALQLVRVGSDL